MTGSPAHDSIVTENLTKAYGSLVALQDCNLWAHAGEVLGLLGNNGAGKSTLLRIIVGFVRPTSGSAWVNGRKVTEEETIVRESLAYLPADARFPRGFTGKEVLRIWSGLHSRGSYSRSESIASRLDLDLTRRVGLMSTGMRQKLALAVVLGIDAPILFLDEPTANLDPQSRQEVLKLVLEAKALGRCVVFSNHVFNEVDEVADRVAVLSFGRLVQISAIQKLRSRCRISGRLNQRSDPVPRSDSWVYTEEGDGAFRFELTTHEPLNEILLWLSRQNVTDLRIEPAGLPALYQSVAAEATK